jgi:DNA invertase Pin-like site-specific DNA recombinase
VRLGTKAVRRSSAGEKAGDGQLVDVALAVASALTALLAVAALSQWWRGRRSPDGRPDDQLEPSYEVVPGPVAPRIEVSALGYVCGDDDTTDPGARLLERLCAARGWALAGVICDTERPNGRGLARDGLQDALGRLARNEASALVVCELSQLTRSTVELGELFAWFDRAGTRLVSLRPELDTGGEVGRLAAEAVSAMGFSERDLLAERARDGLADARARGDRTGPPAVHDNPELTTRIQEMRRDGMSLRAIADRLNADGVPTLRGGARWWQSSVQSALGYSRPRRPRQADYLPVIDRPGDANPSEEDER